MENRFFLWTKILIKIKTRDKKKLIKNIHGVQFSKGQCSGGQFFEGHFFRGQFSGRHFPGGFFLGAFFLEPLKISLLF